MDYKELLNEQLDALEQGRRFTVVTVIHADDATTRTFGKMLVFEDGSAKGTIGGGAVERLAIRDALSCMQSRQSAVKEYDLNSEASAKGEACGGCLRVMIEVADTKPLLVICGAGHVGGALARIARFIGFEVLMVDNREPTLIAASTALADRFYPIASFVHDFDEVELPEEAYYVVATYGHSHDAEALAGVLRRKSAYVGMIGSKVKAGAVFEKLRGQGVSDVDLNRVHTPIGLDLGGETPEEIALSILAEIVMIKNSRTGKQLSDLT